MKKILFSCLLAAAALSAAAQPAGHMKKDGHHLNLPERLAAKSGFNYKLDEFRTDDNYQICTYTYDSRSRLLTTSDSINGEYQVIDSIFYNEQSRLSRLSGWQRINGAFKNVYYIDYGYDEDGNLSSRTNYNKFGDEWSLGGIYNYYYNDNHQITRSTLMLGGTLFQRIEYLYTDGRLARELWYDYNGAGLSLDMTVHYAYNPDGRLLSRCDSMLDGSSWTLYTLRTYEYDADGNCLQTEVTDAAGRVAERSVFTYDLSRPLSEVLMPWTPEQERPKSFGNANPYVIEAYYQLDADQHLQYLCDYVYSYSGYHAAVSTAQTPRLSLSPNPASGRVAVEGLGADPVHVQVVDPLGRTALESRLSQASNTIDVGRLTPGIYLLRAGSRCTKLIVK